MKIVLGVDLANLAQAAVTVQSAIMNADPTSKYDFEILFDGEPGTMEVQVLLEQDYGRHTLAIRTTRPEIADPYSYLSRATFLRLAVPEMLRHDDVALYLDADIIVLRDLTELFKTDQIGGASVAGVPALALHSQIHLGDERLRQHFYGTLGLSEGVYGYINAGVMLMDCEQLRRLRFSEASKQKADKFAGRLFWGDQDLINTILDRRINHLDARWNVAAGYWATSPKPEHLPEELRPHLMAQAAGPWIVHYTGQAKPWNSPNVWNGHLWRDYARQTPAWQQLNAQSGNDRIRP